jgi:hypothetical protein
VLHRAVGSGGAGGSCPPYPDFGWSVNHTEGGILCLPHYYLSPPPAFQTCLRPWCKSSSQTKSYGWLHFQSSATIHMVNCLLSRLVCIQSLALHAFSLSMQGLAFCWKQASHRAFSDSYDFGSHSRLWNTPVIFLLRSSFSVFWTLKNKFSSHP